MLITIFGANGKVGRLVVAEALSRGHTVRAFCRSQPRFVAHPALTIVRGDIHDASAVETALRGSDAVISTLGSWGTPTKDILTTGIRNIIAAMQSANVRRIVSLTGADARAPGDSLSLLHNLSHAAIQLFAKKILVDGEQHIYILAASKLEWTVIRSPVMVGLSHSSHYALSDSRPLPWQTVSRRAVAASMVDAIDNKSHYRSAPFVHN